MRVTSERLRFLTVTLASAACVFSSSCLVALAGRNASSPAAKPDASASQASFLQVYKVLLLPRCANSHPSGEAPPQGDDSQVHMQNDNRGKDGHGVTAMRCNTCDQEQDFPGNNMPPDNPKWSLPAPEHKMVFVGRPAGALCRQIKDPKQNGGRTLEQLFDHVAHDDLVAGG
jgi:hypothetical protein